ncbi:hypothetical protein ACFLUG_02530 [Chloroflexota bacterium]
MIKKLFLLVMVVVLILLSACSLPEPGFEADDQAAIYTAVISYVYRVDNTFGDKEFSVVYLTRYSDDSVGDPVSTEASPELISEPVQAAIIVGLEGLPAEIIWVDDTEQVPVEEGMVAGDGAIITVGNIHQQWDGTVQVPASIYFANLGAGGATYIVEKIDDIWTVTGNTGPRWIS